MERMNKRASRPKSQIIISYENLKRLSYLRGELSRENEGMFTCQDAINHPKSPGYKKFGRFPPKTISKKRQKKRGL